MSSRQATMPLLRLENVSVIRGNRIVLNGISLDAGPGDIIWIRGANGCGKSTLLRLIAGLLSKASGSMLVEGRLALADENLALDTNLSVESALRFWADIDDATPAARAYALHAVDLAPLADVPIRLLSTGQRKRASLARLLTSNAQIWLLDEPYNGLDSASTERLDQALLAHISAGGMALVAAHQSPSIVVAQSLRLDERVTAL
ncbi:MAG: heme ABC exporter ATP-binding protein CcmA [Sphingorhabdus sp.]